MWQWFLKGFIGGIVVDEIETMAFIDPARACAAGYKKSVLVSIYLKATIISGYKF